MTIARKSCRENSARSHRFRLLHRSGRLSVSWLAQLSVAFGALVVLDDVAQDGVYERGAPTRGPSAATGIDGVVSWPVAPEHDTSCTANGYDARPPVLARRRNSAERLLRIASR